LVSGSLLVRDTALDRLRDVCSAEDIARHPGCLDRDRPLVWVRGFGNWGHIGGNANAASLSHTTGGFLIGTDVPVYDWRIGFFGGYSRTDFDVDTRSSWGSSDNYHLGAYGGTNWDDVAIRLGASYSWNDLSTERRVAFGNFSNDLHASYNAGTAQIFGEVGESFAFDRLNVEPFANLSYVNLRTYAFREGGGEAALSSAANTQEDTFATIGLRPSTDFTIASLSLRAQGMFGWRHTFGTVTPNATVAFAGGDAFTVTGAPIARDAGVVEAGISSNVTEAAAISLTYGAQFGGRESNNGIRGTLAIAF
jgi:outer membrane autotransporter protein